MVVFLLALFSGAAADVGAAADETMGDYGAEAVAEADVAIGLRCAVGSFRSSSGFSKLSSSYS